MQERLNDYFAFAGFSTWQELPRIELYMDQLISIIESELSPLQLLGKENSITASMVNNYVKVKLVPAPQKKRYQRAHICALLLIFSLKTVLSMQELAVLLTGLLDEHEGDWEAVYAQFCAELESALTQVFNPKSSTTPDTDVSVAGPAFTLEAHSASPSAALALHHAVKAFAHRLKAQEQLNQLDLEAADKPL